MTANEILDAIDGVVGRFCAEGEVYVRRSYDEYVPAKDGGEPYWISFYVEEEIDKLLSGLRVPHSCECVIAYEGINLDAYVCCVSFVYPPTGKLYTNNFAVENRMEVL